MGNLGVPELIIIAIITGFPLVLVVGSLLVLRFRRSARRLGYRTTSEYLRAVPRSDGEKRDAADLAVLGLVLCLLGIVYAPVVLAGLVPFFYGARKMAYATLGLGLVDDGDASGL